MRKFTVRIEFGRNNGENTKRLCALISDEGFSSHITSDQGGVFQLPEGEFNFSGDIDKKVILERLKLLTAQIDNDCHILITESKGRIWHNLKAI